MIRKIVLASTLLAGLALAGPAFADHHEGGNPCAAKNPCAEKNPCADNPCAAKNPCAEKNPCADNPCAGKK